MSLVFSTPEPHHFSDYGFDPQITHFQLAEESRRQCRGRASLKPIDTIRFKLKKPISKDESRITATTAAATKFKTKTKKKQRWWKNALSYLKSKWADKNGPTRAEVGQQHTDTALTSAVYSTHCGSGSTTPFRSYGATTTFGWMMGDEIPYLRLREMNMGESLGPGTFR